MTCSCDSPVMTCQDPGNVAHSRKVIAGSRFTVGSTVQFICNKGYLLSGSSLLTCYNRDSATPKWSERLPKCVRKSQTLEHTYTPIPWVLILTNYYMLFWFCITFVSLLTNWLKTNTELFIFHNIKYKSRKSKSHFAHFKTCNTKTTKYVCGFVFLYLFPFLFATVWWSFVRHQTEKIYSESFFVIY